MLYFCSGSLIIELFKSMARRRNKHVYHQPQRTNPEVIARKLDKISIELEHHKNLIRAINEANDRHVEQLSNFVRHDMKNAIQGLDGTIFNAKQDNTVDRDVLEQLETCLSLLRGSLDNFAKIIPSSNNPYTTLPDILSAVELLSRGHLQQEKVSFIFDYDRGSAVLIHHPMQTLVQVIHNLVINAVNSMKDVDGKSLLVKGSVSDEICEIRIYDNGLTIPDENRAKIFDYGFSTTNGTGIGLFHAQSVLNRMKGNIIYQNSDLENYVKYFLISFNINQQDYE